MNYYKFDPRGSSSNSLSNGSYSNKISKSEKVTVSEKNQQTVLTLVRQQHKGQCRCFVLTAVVVVVAAAAVVVPTVAVLKNFTIESGKNSAPIDAEQKQISDSHAPSAIVPAKVDTLNYSPSVPSPTPSTTSATSESQMKMRMFGSETLLDFGTGSVLCGISNPEEWSALVIRHTDLSGNQRPVCSLDRGDNPKCNENIDAKKVSFKWNETESEIYLLVAFNPTNCADVGTYFCDFVTPMRTESAQADVRAKALPSSPVLTMTSSMQSGQQIDMVCEGSLGAPQGRMLLFVKDILSGAMKQLEPSDGEVTEVERQGCQFHATSTFSVATAGRDVIVICTIENNALATNVIRMTSERELKAKDHNSNTS